MKSLSNGNGQPAQGLRPGYLLVGSGHVARHLSHYFQLEKVNHLRWSRAHAEVSQLKTLVPLAGRVLLAVRDDAIQEVLKLLCLEQDQVAVHFSGALRFCGAVSCHPLVSFSGGLHDLGFYKKIYFAIEQGVDFEQVFPELSNPCFVVGGDMAGFYHSLLVLKASLDYFLNPQLFVEFEKRGWPKEGLMTFIESLKRSLNTDGAEFGTGPLLRQDQITIENNLNSLTGHPLKELYEFLHHQFRQNTKTKEG